ncbi:MAG: hypothetical protein ACO248_00855 [Burkholderiaceae bacterium]
MNRNHTRQLAELALATRDTDLLAKACQQLLAEIDMPVTLPLFQQPALAAADQVAALDRALDNLPPVVYHQAPVQRIEVGTTPVAVIEKDTGFGVDVSVKTVLQQWRTAFGDAWRSNSEAFGFHQHREAHLAQINAWLDLAVEADANPKMSMRMKAKIFWERARMLKIDGYRIEHRVRDCGTYHVNEHRVLEVPKMFGGN